MLARLRDAAQAEGWLFAAQQGQDEAPTTLVFSRASDPLELLSGVARLVETAASSGWLLRRLEITGRGIGGVPGLPRAGHGPSDCRVVRQTSRSERSAWPAARDHERDARTDRKGAPGRSDLSAARSRLRGRRHSNASRRAALVCLHRPCGVSPGRRRALELITPVLMMTSELPGHVVRARRRHSPWITDERRRRRRACRMRGSR